MSGDVRARAEAAQRRAAAPEVSAFVAASAGSGKTKLLTDRLLRLMLSGADPQRIQCLTYTKAAAAEMALRLQTVLGRWVTLPDAALDAALAGLAITPDAATRTAARALFARVLDLPGGMRIGTIHAFCQSLLRRFPLEARLSPHFALLDDTDAALAMAAAQEDVLAGARDPARRADLETLAGLVSLGEFAGLVGQLRAEPERLRAAFAHGAEALETALMRVLGGEPDEAARMARAVAWSGEDTLRATLRQLADKGSTAVAARALRALDWLALPAGIRAEQWPEWRCEFLLDGGAPRGIGALINPKLANAHPEMVEALTAEQARIAAIEDLRRAAITAALSAALARLAHPVAAAYAARKDGIGKLDFDDLIARTSDLLVDPGAAWVLYKLDGGLDHLLLDEVQDTAPAQWRIAGAMTGEFFAGDGAQAGKPRTVFAVGDRKQSIFGFLGADPAAFETWRGHLSARVRDAGQAWEDVALDVSFRSTAPVLALVDAVFAAPDAAAGVVAPGETLRHHPDRAGHAGSIELWPLLPPPEVAAAEPWQVPEHNLPSPNAMHLLADALARWIETETRGTVMLESRGRPLRAGDVLVLLRRRNEFATALMRALKARGVQVAGLDRMVLTDQPAVADLLVLIDTLLLPQDDLSLAAVLTSPLGGLSQDSLLALAAPRDGALWDRLRARAEERDDWAAAWRFLSALFARVDFATPHALLAEALGQLGGRARLLARLGPEAAEPIDELLHAALDFTTAHPPSLQGFVQWARASAAEGLRQTDGAGDMVRIMTVHGAKGLQAPLVILPDTTALPPNREHLFWLERDGATVPVWLAKTELGCVAAEGLRQTARQAAMEEHNRLLYVALTRAEDRLVVCGWQPKRAPQEACWYRLIERGFRALAAGPVPFAAIVANPWAETAWCHATPQQRPPEMAKAATAAFTAPSLPIWAGSAPDWRAAAPPPEPDLPMPLAPSRPPDAALGPVPEAASPLAERDMAGQRFRRGKLVHALLQHLPALPPAERPVAARRFLDRPGHALAADDVTAITRDVLAVLAHPFLAPLFGPEGRAEAPLTGVIAGRVVGGLVDRLAVLPDRVLIADYKTNRAPPASPADVPVLYLRQMAAYRAVLAAIHPDRPVACALVWTSGAQVMELPAALLDLHAPGAETHA